MVIYEQLGRQKLLTSPCAAEAMRTLRSTTLIDLLVWGDPVICRAMVLVLQGPEYNPRFFDATSLDELSTLENVQVLLLAPGLVTERRGVSRTEIVDLMRRKNIPILELVAAFEERKERLGTPAWSEHRVPWPCSTDELKRHIRAAVANNQDTDGRFVEEVREASKKVHIQDVGEGQEQGRPELQTVASPAGAHSVSEKTSRISEE